MRSGRPCGRAAKKSAERPGASDFGARSRRLSVQRPRRQSPCVRRPRRRARPSSRSGRTGGARSSLQASAEPAENRPRESPFLRTTLILTKTANCRRVHWLFRPRTNRLQRAQSQCVSAALYTGNAHDERILALLVQFVTHVISAGGYAGIVALMAMNSAGIPLPPSSSCRSPATWFIWAASISFWWRRRGGGLQSWLGHRVLDRRQGRASAGGALRQMGSDEPSRSGPHDWFLRKVRIDRGSAGAHAAGGANVYRLSGGNRRMPRLRFHIYTSVGSWPGISAWPTRA
jgi:hypothetical protein